MPNSMRALLLLQALHENIRKEIQRRQIDTTGRRAVEEAARQIEATEARFFYLSIGLKPREDKPHNSHSERRRYDHAATSSRNEIVVAVSRPPRKPVEKIKNREPPQDLFEITCYNCQQTGHYRSTRSKSQRKQRKARGRTTSTWC